MPVVILDCWRMLELQWHQAVCILPCLHGYSSIAQAGELYAS